MTANALDEDVKQTREAEMDAHIGKPIDTNTLYKTMEQLLSLKRFYKQKKILIVDDVEVNREVIKASLHDEYTLLEAENGKEAIEILNRENGIDMIITDLQMPEMDGIALIQYVRSHAKYKNIGILANTQYGNPEQEEELLELGANDFIYKPTTPKVIKSRVHNVLKR